MTPEERHRLHHRQCRRRAGVPVILLAVAILTGCSGKSDTGQTLRGPTMGTQFLVRTACTDAALDAAIRSTLTDIEDEMSTYREDSLLSRFNRAPVGEWFTGSAGLLAVLQPARELSLLSDGAFDVTVGPLVNLWGFGPDGQPENPPTPSEVEAAQGRVGYQFLELRPPADVRKTRELYVDLSAIAKGYAVDQVAELLEAHGCIDYLVEIGGEIRIRGHKADGTGWRIGLETPDPNVVGGVLRVIEADAIALATSGDYRNFYEQDGRRLSHTIDPRTGRPVQHALASVTVVHHATLWADGFATLLNVLGPDAGFELAERQDIAALFIVHTEDGFREKATTAFQPHLNN